MPCSTKGCLPSGDRVLSIHYAIASVSRHRRRRIASSSGCAIHNKGPILLPQQGDRTSRGVQKQSVRLMMHRATIILTPTLGWLEWIQGEEGGGVELLRKTVYSRQGEPVGHTPLSRLDTLQQTYIRSPETDLATQYSTVQPYTVIYAVPHPRPSQ